MHTESQLSWTVVQAHPQMQVVLCVSEPIEIPALACVTYVLEDLGADSVAHVLSSIAPQVCPCAMLVSHIRGG